MGNREREKKSRTTALERLWGIDDRFGSCRCLKLTRDNLVRELLFGPAYHIGRVHRRHRLYAIMLLTGCGSVVAGREQLSTHSHMQLSGDRLFLLRNLRREPPFNYTLHAISCEGAVFVALSHEMRDAGSVPA